MQHLEWSRPGTWRQLEWGAPSHPGAAPWPGSSDRTPRPTALASCDAQALAAALREVGARFVGLRCCQMPALDAIPPSQLGKLPALFCYREGSLQHSLMGAQAFGEAPSAAQLVSMLSELEVIDAAEGRPMGGAVSEHESDDLSD